MVLSPMIHPSADRPLMEYPAMPQSSIRPFNRPASPYFYTTRRNAEGFPTFERSFEEAYLQVLLTNTLGDHFMPPQQNYYRHP